MHERRFGGAIERLRDPERVQKLEVARVTQLFLENASEGSLLDVGTGSGLFAEAFALKGLTVAGLDVKPEMLAAARGFVPQGEFRTGLVEALPYSDKSYDFIFLGLVLHESDDPLKALQEAYRVARDYVGVLEWPYRDGTIGPSLEDRMKPEDLAVLFRKAGFRKWKLHDLQHAVLYKLEI